MTRLPALTYREVLARLRRAGFEFDRQAKGSHEIWYNPATHRRTTGTGKCSVPRPARLEGRLVKLVNAMYGLTPDEVALLWHTAAAGRVASWGRACHPERVCQP